MDSNVCAYISFEGEGVSASYLSNDSATDGVRVQAAVDSRVLLVAGKPLHEPIAQHEPFVMTRPEQIEATLRDYRDGKFIAIAMQAEGSNSRP